MVPGTLTHSPAAEEESVPRARPPPRKGLCPAACCAAHKVLNQSVFSPHLQTRIFSEQLPGKEGVTHPRGLCRADWAGWNLPGLLQRRP